MMPDMLLQAAALMRRSKTCLIGSIDCHGYPAIRAMLQPREMDAMKSVYFSTNSSSQHIAQYKENANASIYFYDCDVFQGLLLRGKMQVSTDQRLRDRLWRDGDNMYYKLGKSDPDYSVMTFTATNGRWYDNFTSVDFLLG